MVRPVRVGKTARPVRVGDQQGPEPQGLLGEAGAGGGGAVVGWG